MYYHVYVVYDACRLPVIRTGLDRLEHDTGKVLLCTNNQMDLGDIDEASCNLTSQE